MDVGETMIHVVDDDEARSLALQGLLRALGWQARAFRSAREYIAALPHLYAPNCLLLDLSRPGMSGAELLESLAATHVSIPAIMMTGDNDSVLAVRARNAGAFEVLEKPVDKAELKQSIDRVLSAT